MEKGSFSISKRPPTSLWLSSSTFEAAPAFSSGGVRRNCFRFNTEVRIPWRCGTSGDLHRFKLQIQRSHLGLRFFCLVAIYTERLSLDVVELWLCWVTIYSQVHLCFADNIPRINETELELTCEEWFNRHRLLTPACYDVCEDRVFLFFVSRATMSLMTVMWWIDPFSFSELFLLPSHHRFSTVWIGSWPVSRWVRNIYTCILPTWL